MTRPSNTVLLLLLGSGLLALAPMGCERVPVPEDVVPPVTVPQLEPLGHPWTRAELREVVDLQVARDADGLRALLTSDDAEVRARAALALASVQSSRAVGDLQALLADADPAVRREAVFALGQADAADRGESLMAALSGEEDPDVRRRLIEALGKRAPAADVLLELEPRDPGEAAERALALARLALRGVRGEGLVDELLGLLDHTEPAVRTNAAYYLGRTSQMAPWAEEMDRIREALDVYAPNEPAAMYLLAALGLRRDPEDRDRILHWMSHAQDWRIRANAARALGSPAFMELRGVESALYERIEHDPSVHVAVAAAGALTMGGGRPDGLTARMETLIRQGDPGRWQAQLPLVEYAGEQERMELIMEWVERMRTRNPTATARGVRLLGRPVEAPGVRELLFDLLDHDDARVKAVAARVLAERWLTTPTEDEEFSRLVDRFGALLEEGEAPVALAITRAVASPAWTPFGAPEVLLSAFRELDPDETHPTVLVGYMEALASVGGDGVAEAVETYVEHPHLRVRAIAGEVIQVFTGRRPEGTRIEGPERTVDWEALEALGPAPRLHLETDRGEIVVRLLPGQAPLTVQAMAELAAAGAYDGTHFHRVLPNFVVQGGDVTARDGSGSPGYALRSEFTRLPFARGVLGMASSGKDTEGSQFFLTHSMQPHLDGGYTAFGWVESGAEVMDAVLEGDRLISARVEPGDEG
jgi:cyclophilin family peptidyl-prolyl cis-trans isomerase/HEAT repeat protein